MNKTQINELQQTLKDLKARKGEDAVITVGAVAGISRRRMLQLVAGEGDPPTRMEYNVIMMLK